MVSIFIVNFFPSISCIENLNYNYRPDGHYQTPFQKIILNNSIDNFTYSDDCLYSFSRENPLNHTSALIIKNEVTDEEIITTSYPWNYSIYGVDYGDPDSHYFGYSSDPSTSIGWYFEERSSFKTHDINGMLVLGVEFYFYVVNLTNGLRLWWSVDIGRGDDQIVYYNQNSTDSLAKFFFYDNNCHEIIIFSLELLGEGEYHPPKYFGWQYTFKIRLEILSSIMGVSLGYSILNIIIRKKKGSKLVIN
ncbi:hypothetical protein NEF87_004252 [Candidatus Lokiarchaeum ossiferum]|uniref:Uncharacterized protein n=1 Tax=Candidatus Lokiarchaeum ossiferum TaxID=2951803 RepID=A0ABY6HYM3_9ARCH|nr:hypothetical protein NEF87_004252 [Candidatus Lokiarchaeum sp. B-35]